MDSVDRVIRNLEYQKNYFPEFYNEYISEALAEVAMTKIEDNVEVNKNLNIVILCDSFNEALENIFYLKDIELEEFKEIFIRKSYKDKLEEDESSVTLNLVHPYLVKDMTIRLIKRLTKDSLENASLFIGLKRLNIFDKKIILGANVRNINVESFEDLKNELINFKATYYEKAFIEKNLVSKNEEGDTENLNFDEIKASISFDFIKKIVNKKSSESYLEIINLLLNKCINYFKVSSNKLLLKYENINFRKGDNYLNYQEKKELFKEMYLTVNILLNNIDKLENELEITKENFINELKDFDNSLSKSNLYTNIMNSNIVEFDRVTSKYLNKFKDEITKVKV